MKKNEIKTTIFTGGVAEVTDWSTGETIPPLGQTLDGTNGGLIIKTSTAEPLVFKTSIQGEPVEINEGEPYHVSRNGVLGKLDRSFYDEKAKNSSSLRIVRTLVEAAIRRLARKQGLDHILCEECDAHHGRPNASKIDSGFWSTYEIDFHPKKDSANETLRTVHRFTANEVMAELDRGA